jgi:hypothetical protein
MFELNDLCHRLLQAIVSAPLAWQSPPQLATRLGLDLDATTDALADLDLAGWIDPWEMGEITYVTLSPAGAERLRVRLVLIGRSDAMRWSSLDDPEPEPPRASGRHEGMSALDFVSDPAPGPDLALEIAEIAHQVSNDKFAANNPTWIDSLPRPLLLLGSGLSPWPGPGRDPMRPCPGCGSRPISELAYCLVCDRWGLDYRLATRKVRICVPRPNRNPMPPPHNPSDAKAARRAKRRRKWDEKLAKARAAKSRPTQPATKPAPGSGQTERPEEKPALASASR